MAETNAVIGQVALWPCLRFIRWAPSGDSPISTEQNGEVDWSNSNAFNALQRTLQTSSLASTTIDLKALHLIVFDHGCGYVTTICLDNDPKLNGTVWVGGAFDYIEDEIDFENPNWYGHKWVKRDWVTWLREELDRIEMQYHAGKKVVEPVGE